MKRLVAVLVLMCALTAGCGDRHTTVVEAPAQPVVVAAQPQVVYVANPDPMAGVLTGMAIGAIMSNGMRYDGHNGYLDSHYHGPSRTIVRNTTVVNKTVINNGPSMPGPKAAEASTPVAKPAAPVANPRQAEIDAYKQKAVAAKPVPVVRPVAVPVRQSIPRMSSPSPMRSIPSSRR